jgi:5-formyltetrahydrofolate cyclo-ligase
LPILTDSNALRFVRYDENDELHLNKYSIPEPVNISREIISTQLDMVITPLVAFDLNGYRLGAGGGYYDRTFEFLHNKNNKKPQIIGLAYSAQQAEIIPVDPWDILLNGVLTEKEFIVF